MSNYAKVMVCWSGIDDLAHPRLGQDGGNEEAVVATINRLFSERHKEHNRGWTISYSCGDKSLGNSCEVVAIADFNYFEPWKMDAILRSMKWSRPEEVEFFWKDEDMERYERHGLDMPPLKETGSV